MKGLDKKLGPLKLWQWLVIGTGAGVAYYLYKKSHESKAEVNPEEEEKLLGALGRTGGGGGGEGSVGSTGSNSLPVPGPQGPTGEIGIAGPQGGQGPQGEAPSAGLEAKVNTLQEEIVKNNPPTTSHNGAPQALPKGEARNSKGEIYRTIVKGNNIYHEYLNRKGPSKILKVGERHVPAKKAKRPKPTPVHRKVAPKHAPRKAKKREPVHR